MIFDKGQNAFPSDFHREVWWWAIGLVPTSESLTDEVKSKCGPEVLEGCHQWYEYFTELCEDMYNHANAYLPASPRQYRDILESIASGEWSIDDWNAFRVRLDKSKAYQTAGIKLDSCLLALERTGLRVEYISGSVIFSHDKYPKIFHAMHVMERSPDIRKTPARHHFAHCEFRQLFKSYAANYDGLLRRASEDSLYIAHSVHDLCKSLKIQRYIHFGIIKYKYKGIRVLDFDLHGNEYPTLRINMGTCANQDIDGYYKVLLTQNCDIQGKFIKFLVKCGDPGHKRYPVVINGQEELICPCSRLKINPSKEDLEAISAFITARKASIDQ